MTYSDPKASPMMEQWHQCKTEAKEAILFFRLGDFYEAFYDDAITCSKELDITLTKRQTVPMSGIPAHTAEGYIEKLVLKGYKVAVAEQMGDSKPLKGPMKRAITRIITPGTLLSVSEKSNNYMASITQVGDMIGIAFFDLACSDCRVIEVETEEQLENELYRFKPSEIVTSARFEERHKELFERLKQTGSFQVDILEEWRFDHKLTYPFLVTKLKVHSLDGFGLKGMTSAINAAGALLAYVQDHLHQSLATLTSILPYKESAFLWMDKATMKNLELIESQNGTKKNTLLHILDQTVTPMGARLLKSWVLRPLLSLDNILERLEAIEHFLSHFSELEAFQRHLTPIRDLERILFRIHTQNPSPRDFLALKNSLEPIEKIQSTLKLFKAPLIEKNLRRLSPLKELVGFLENALVDEPPLRLTDGRVFRSGYNEALDELRRLEGDSKGWMADYQKRIQEETQIKTLKVGYTRISGFYIEVSKGALDKVPKAFIRRQTLTNAERFITDELKTYEEKILHAEEQIEAIELSLFQKLKEHVITFSEQVMENARAIAILDTLASMARVARENRFVRPSIGNGNRLDIQEGRHPVVESGSLSEKFVPNDTLLDSEKNRLMLITGPNMAGKSTYMKQVALIVILAQIGSFIPAKRAHIDLVDKVFTRIGASDDLARGQSTFMVEMTETAAILHHATNHSLVILDEIGRGTSTYDGISLAWSIAEYLLTTHSKQAKTLFATHYFELTKLEEKIEGAVNYHVAVHETGDQILFLRKIVQGGTDKSYGIHVAKLAGLPTTVLIRAEEILLHLVENGGQKGVFEPPKKIKKSLPQNEKTGNELQLSFL